MSLRQQGSINALNGIARGWWKAMKGLNGFWILLWWKRWAEAGGFWVNGRWCQWKKGVLHKLGMGFGWRLAVVEDDQQERLMVVWVGRRWRLGIGDGGVSGKAEWQRSGRWQIWWTEQRLQSCRRRKQAADLVNRLGEHCRQGCRNSA